MLENNTPRIPVTFLEVNSVLSVGTIFVVPSDFSNANFRTNNGPILGNSSREQVLTCPILILEDSIKICTGRVTVNTCSYSYLAINITFKCNSVADPESRSTLQELQI